MARPRGELVYEVLREVRPLTLLSARIVEQTVRDVGLTVGTRAVLELLVRGGAATVPALAARLDVSRQAVQRLVDDLLEGGLVLTRENPAHRRSVLVEPTDPGERVFLALHAAEVGTLGRMLDGVTHEDLLTTVRVLSHLRADVRKRGRSLGAAQ